MFGIQDLSGEIGVASLVECAFLLALLTIYFIIFMVKPNIFG